MEVLVSSGRRFALMRELRGETEPTLQELLARLAPADLVIVEGYKTGPHPKIEVHRHDNGKPLLFPNDKAIVGIAAGAAVDTHLPFAHLDDIPAVAAIMLAYAVDCAGLDRDRS